MQTGAANGCLPREGRSRTLTAGLSVYALIAGCFAYAPGALAHAVLQSSQPQANATVETAKLTAGSLPIVLTFNSRIDAAHSSLSLVSGDSPAVKLTIDTKAAPNVLHADAPRLRPGHYALHWQAVAADGHISRGAVPFNLH